MFQAIVHPLHTVIAVSAEFILTTLSSDASSLTENCVCMCVCVYSQ